MEAAWQFLKKLNIELSHDPAIPFLGVYPKELKTGVQRKTYTQIFIAVMEIIQMSINSLDKQKCGTSMQ